MSDFLPIAVIGQGCVLPGALDPEQLWETVAAGDDALGTVPDDYWGVDPAEVATSADDPEPDKTWTDRGGFVRGFDEVFDPSGFRRSKDEIQRLDPIFQWGLYAGRQALRNAGLDTDKVRDRAGVILGNKSYPTHSLANFSEDVWREQNGWDTVHNVDATNRFMSGLPAQLVADAMGFKGGSFCLDVACASSLYAIKLACDRLQRGDADLMLAGGINRADDLFLRIGFCALQAMSKTGQSRPFHRRADGLVPAEGAGFVALKRLDDAVGDGDDIVGVIRGAGLSNDGRSRGLLTPSEDGQVRCMKQAYRRAGIDPATVSMVECHAAGTALGDATEVRSVSRIFEDVDEQLPIASLKSNLGHLITVSGVAGLLKVTGAMKHQIRPATLNADDPIDELKDGPLRHLTESEDWDVDDGPRRAAINNFGFGGNNAHLIVEEFQPDAAATCVDVQVGATKPKEVAVVDISVIAADGDDRDDFASDLFYDETRLREGKTGPEARADNIELDVGEVRFPPLDLKKAIPQQLMILESTLQLKETIDELPTESTGIMLGMQCDAEICRYLVRWRLGKQLVDDDGDHRDGLIQALDAAGVLGSMPNLVTNRLNSQFDLAGASLTLSGEELSGMLALELAAESLRTGELDAAVVGAVDLSCEPVHRAAVDAVLDEDRQIPGDAAVSLVLKRVEDARRDGDEIHAVLPATGSVDTTAEKGEKQPDAGDDEQSCWEVPDLAATFGHPHAASGLLRVAAAIEASSRRARPARADQPPMPWLPDRGRRRARVEMETVTGDELSTTIEAMPGRSPNAFVEGSPPDFDVYAGDDLSELRRAVKNDQQADDGDVRLAISGGDEKTLKTRRKAAIEALKQIDEAPSYAKIGRGIYLGSGDAGGETSFVFTGPAGSYQGMGRELVLALPELADGFARRCHAVDRAAGWIYDEPSEDNPGPGKKLWGASFLCQVHAQLTRDILGIEPEAAIGFCAGETNALFAMGAWNDFDGLYEDLEREGIFDRRLGGEFETVGEAFDVDGDEAQWQTWRLLAPLDTVEPIVDAQERCYVTIVNAPGDLVIGGTPDACARVIDKVGKKRARPLGYNIAMHCPATKPIEGLWHDMHHRPTESVPGVRFYTHSSLDHYEVDADKIADALVGQALGRVDFPKLINKAWDDGVRVFIEHGPRSGCTRWIRKILGDREHVAVSLDRTGKSSLDRVVDTTARLWAAGLDIDTRNLTDRLDAAESLRGVDGESESSENSGTTLNFSAHLPPVKLPAPQGTQRSSSRSKASKQPENRGGTCLPLSPLLPSVSASLPELRAEPVRRPKKRAPNPQEPAAPTPQQGRSQQRRGPRYQEQSQSKPASHSRPQQSQPNRQPDGAGVGHVDDQPRTEGGRLAELHDRFLRRRANLHQEFLDRQNQRAQWFLEMHQRGVQPEQLSEMTEVPVSELTKPETPRPDAGHPPVHTAASPARTNPGVQSPAPGQNTSTTAQPTASAPSSVDDSPPVEVLFDRRDILVHAGGQISEIFGPMFERQDDYPRQTRMPEPPLLLVDRVTGLDATKGAMENQGAIWTETDIADDAWYLHRGRMPVGLTVESGQADLMLISWMGANFESQGQRVYRLLGCELTFHGDLPKPGETLEFEIHIDAHARQGDVHIFFFHYDCLVDGEPRLTMRNGQAGFFTDQELANSEGVLWTPDDIDSSIDAADPFEPPVTPDKTAFSGAELEAFSEDRPFDCFGDGFERLAAHTETPKIQGDEMLFLDEVDVFDPDGGPHGRGYLRATQNISADDWFFSGHFKNDPCMPGTLMLQACTQAMAFYMTGLGLTLDRDGWRFEPVSDESCAMRCRGQVTPDSDQIVYELYVREVVDGPAPRLYADLLCTVDGLKAFHCERLALELVADWPLTRHPEWIDDEIAKNVGEDRPAATIDGFAYDQASIMACCIGRPSEAFGPMYEPFDGPRRAPRLPNPPYLFISRIADVSGTPAGMEQGSTVVAEYDVPDDAWYFDEGNSGAMPFAALMEVGLQPCGWLASYVGCALTTDRELFFRNLDGTGIVYGEVTAESDILETKAALKTLSRSGGMIIVGFDVEVFADGERVFSMDTVFGFFPEEALASQDGLATSDEARARLDEPSGETFDAEIPGLADSLEMFDRVTGWWPDGGESSLGRVRTEQDVDPRSWYFNSHFFQDPVQPGSLGVEGMLQLLQWVMLEKGMDQSIEDPRFVPIATGRETSWKYRGQVVPENDVVILDMEITECSTPGDDETFAVATASLWVDGARIYEVSGLGMEIVDDPAGDTQIPQRAANTTTILDPQTDTWLKDHRPTFTRPALPMMSIADYLAQAATDALGGPVAELRDVHLMGWAVVDGPTELAATVSASERGEDWCEVALETPEKQVATGQVRVGDYDADAPQPMGEVDDGQPIDDPYESGAVFHGPAFQLLKSGREASGGSSGILDAGLDDVPVGQLHPALLDAALHIIPHDNLSRWSDDVDSDTVAYPHRLDYLTVHGPTPTAGDIRVETRLIGFADNARFPVFHIQFLDGDTVWADLQLVEALFPKGRIAQGDPDRRRAFLRDRQYVDGFGVSQFDGDTTRLSVPEFRKNDWFEGTIAAIYNLDTALDLVEQTRQAAIKDHVARSLNVHPANIDIQGTTAKCEGQSVTVSVENEGPMEFAVTS